jgi:WD40 repeat protein
MNSKKIIRRNWSIVLVILLSISCSLFSSKQETESTRSFSEIIKTHFQITESQMTPSGSSTRTATGLLPMLTVTEAPPTPIPSNTSTSTPEIIEFTPANSIIALDNIDQLSKLGFLNNHGHIAWSNDGFLFAIGARDGIYLYDGDSFEFLTMMQTGKRKITSMAFSKNNQLIGSVSDYSLIEVWDLTTNDLIFSFDSEDTTVNLIFDIDFIPGSNLLAACFDLRDPNIAVISLWDVYANESVRSIAAQLVKYETFSISTDGNIIATGYGERYLNLWNPHTGGEYISAIGSSYDHTVLFSPDSIRIAAFESLGSYINIWDIYTAEKLITLQDDNIIVPFKTITFSPDGYLLASTGLDSKLRIWEVNSGQLILLIENVFTYVSAAFSPDGKMLALVLEDETTVIMGIP